jgi:hypothetical protein
MYLVNFRPMLGKRVGPVLIALVFGLVGCGDSSDASRPDPTVPEATTSTTVPPFDAAALPEHPLADEADFDAIVRELFAIRDDAFRYLDLDRLYAVYDEACECRKEADEIRAAIKEGYRIEGDEVVIESVEVEDVVDPRASVVRAKVDLPAIEHVGPEGRVEERGELSSRVLRIALGHAGQRWVVVNFDILEAE